MEGDLSGAGLGTRERMGRPRRLGKQAGLGDSRQAPTLSQVCMLPTCTPSATAEVPPQCLPVAPLAPSRRKRRGLPSPCPIPGALPQPHSWVSPQEGGRGNSCCSVCQRHFMGAEAVS